MRNNSFNSILQNPSLGPQSSTVPKIGFRRSMFDFRLIGKGAGYLAKRMECGQLAPAFERPNRSKAPASRTHSIRFARFASNWRLILGVSLGFGACSLGFSATADWSQWGG